MRMKYVTTAAGKRVGIALVITAVKPERVRLAAELVAINGAIRALKGRAISRA